MKDPFRPLDDEGRAMAAQLLTDARHGALGVLLPDGAPMVTRVACSWDGGRSADRRPSALILVSTLSTHTEAAMSRPETSLLVGEPGARGDPLTHPRLTVLTRAERADKAGLRSLWLTDHPKAGLYIDFADFLMLRLVVMGAYLNGGFGKAYRLSPDDLTAL
jgi:heme iron utilization protein